MILAELGDYILNNDNFIITAHEAPDGDAIGSEIVLYSILRYLGKNALVLNSDPLEHKYSFMDPEKVIRQIKSDEKTPGKN